jgi:hypothetical protein
VIDTGCPSLLTREYHPPICGQSRDVVQHGRERGTSATSEGREARGIWRKQPGIASEKADEAKLLMLHAFHEENTRRG